MSEKVLTIAEYIQSCGGAACGLTRLRELRSDQPLAEHEQAAYDACVATCPNAPCLEARGEVSPRAVEVGPVDTTTFRASAFALSPMRENAVESSIRSGGRIAFEAYVVAVDGRNVYGEDIPGWEGLSESVRAGWDASAKAVLTAGGGAARETSPEGTSITPLMKPSGAE